MPRPGLRAAFASLVAVLIAVSAVAVAAIIITSGVLGSGMGAPGAALELPSGSFAAQQYQTSGPVEVAGSFQISQPRDPFRPLITPDSPVGGIPGVGGDPQPGNGFTPGGTTITLEEVRDVAGVLRATVIVNGVSYDVGVGDTFAGSYKVVSLSEDKGVFTFGDKAFELGVGQQILK